MLRNAAIAIAAPVLVLLALEGGLRLAGHGRPLSFWVPAPTDGAVQSNRYFGRRFFPPAMARMPEPTRLSDPKPEGTYRIFVIGGSAAMGFPEPAFSFARLLELLLRDRYPEARFEVVNTAMTAINSHVTLPIARDSARYQPDAFVLYLGNNEVVGPYGPGTVFGSGMPHGPLLRLAIALGATRTGQAFRGLIGLAGGDRGLPAGWQGMEMFVEHRVAADDPRLEQTYASFRDNLEAMARAARSAGAKTVLTTVVVNLRDCPPFASEPGSGGAERHYRAALENPPAASSEIRAKLERARDLDMLRFRADSRINAVIRDVAARLGPSEVRLADADEAFARASPAGSPGDEWLLEHVHFRFEGAWLLAKTVADALAIDSGGPFARPSSDRWLTADEAAAKLAYTDWDRLRIAKQIDELMLRPPFTFQMDHDERAQRRKRQLDELDAAVRLDETRVAYEKALTSLPEDPSLLRRYAELLGEAGAYAEAVDQWDRLLRLLPDHPAWLPARGAALRESGRMEAAIADFEAALAQDPLDAAIHFGLGATLQRVGRPAEAERCYERALELDARYAPAYGNIGLIRLEEGDAAAALQQFDTALLVAPSFAPPHNHRGLALASLGRIDEALEAFAAALELEPRLAEAHFHRGALLASTGRFAEAEPHLEEALRLDPRNADAAAGLGAVWASRGELDRARRHYERAVELRPDGAAARFGLGKILEQQGLLEAAVEHYEVAVRSRPDYLEALNNLGVALARLNRLEESRKALERAVAAAPDFEPARLNLEQVRAALAAPR